MMAAILRAIDPRLFDPSDNSKIPSLKYLLAHIVEPASQRFINTARGAFAHRCQICEKLLKQMAKFGEKGEPIPAKAIKDFIIMGGSWEEMLVMACRYSGQEELAEQTLMNHADPFTVDLETMECVSEMESLTDSVRRIIARYQAACLAKDPRVGLFATAARIGSADVSLPVGLSDPALNILEFHRQQAIEERRQRLRLFK